MADSPLLVLVASWAVLWLSAQAGAFLRRVGQDKDEAGRHDLDVILGAALTLLGLIIGFSFSMAISRYDQRKNYEEEEANAIGTEYLRAGLLPSADAARVRGLLQRYLNLRVRFYSTNDAARLDEIDRSTAQLQNDLWSAVQSAAVAQPTQVAALAASGMNDVLNSQGYTQAAWRNRIPAAAWILLAVIAVFANALVGYDAQGSRAQALRFFVLPLIVSVAFMLIADLDSPRGGLIRVRPQNLETLSLSSGAQ
jgi:hypothetical protein